MNRHDAEHTLSVPRSFDPARRPTCLVLSAGAASGVAHLGAIHALQQAGLVIDSVVGTSAGALIGALFASGPTLPAIDRFTRLTRIYLRRTEAAFRAKAGSLVAWKLFTGLSVTPRRGPWVPRVSFHRLVAALDEMLRGVSIERLPIRFAAPYHQRSGYGVKLVAGQAGNLARFAARSFSNPLVFEDLGALGRLEAFDPATDPRAAIPVEVASHLFPGRNLLVVNVTGEAARFQPDIGGLVREVRIAPRAVSPESVLRLGGEFATLVMDGYAAMQAALRA